MKHLPGAMGDRLPDCLDGSIDDELGAEPSELRARSTRVAVDAVATTQSGARTKPIHPDQTWIDGERERRIHQPGMAAQLVLAKPSSAEKLPELHVGGAVVRF